MTGGGRLFFLAFPDPPETPSAEQKCGGHNENHAHGWGGHPKKDNVAVFVKSSTTVADTSWHHLVVTKSGATRMLYIDGVDRTSLLTNQTLINTTSALFLGAKNGTAGFLGAMIDEFAVYNQALSLSTVLDHYKADSGTG